eukprot:CAMPEP_0183379118 /NCGR_PEP_ID=MMETSP0164_2-20130417/125264_1 /TAXON_ID=221442 /ORGANISM="Coccolithus pelagicus ssp braarudi, Strain PLY182g" /LENGTH=113 /DNA_ID=CAMNT_0025556695 /DNA_START=468 /DNA_END=809 /DNA_ORIENTATION=-
MTGNSLLALDSCRIDQECAVKTAESATSEHRATTSASSTTMASSGALLRRYLSCPCSPRGDAGGVARPGRKSGQQHVRMHDITRWYQTVGARLMRHAAAEPGEPADQSGPRAR